MESLVYLRKCGARRGEREEARVRHGMNRPPTDLSPRALRPCPQIRPAFPRDAPVCLRINANAPCPLPHIRPHISNPFIVLLAPCPRFNPPLLLSPSPRRATVKHKSQHLARIDDEDGAYPDERTAFTVFVVNNTRARAMRAQAETSRRSAVRPVNKPTYGNGNNGALSRERHCAIYAQNWRNFAANVVVPLKNPAIGEKKPTPPGRQGP